MIVTDVQKVNAYVSGQLGIEPWSQCSGIGLEIDGRMVGGCIYDHYNGANVCMHIASSGRWTMEFARYIFHYPFIELGVKRITGFVVETNLKSIKWCERIGAVLEARLTAAHPDGDLLIYKLTVDRCKYLKRNK
jgi:RimJ/RimL family protein N-acetyltransferase